MRRVIDDPTVADTLFPPLQLSNLVEYVRAVWDEQKRVRAAWWSAHKETHIVAGFSVALSADARVVESGIGFGHFTIEAQKFELLPNGLPKQIARTDIQFLHGSDFGPVLTMEFKRLDNGTTLRQKYFLSGVHRFITGRYSNNCDFAMMIGMVDGNSAVEKAGMLRYLNRPRAMMLFALQPLTTLAYGDPSFIAPHTDFDTQHRRVGCLTPEITIAHMLLER